MKKIYIYINTTELCFLFGLHYIGSMNINNNSKLLPPKKKKKKNNNKNKKTTKKLAILSRVELPGMKELDFLRWGVGGLGVGVEMGGAWPSNSEPL